MSYYRTLTSLRCLSNFAGRVKPEHSHPTKNPGYCRNLSSAPAAKVKDDPSLWVRSILPDVEVIKGVTMPEYAFEHVGKWENAPAFVRK